VKLVLSSLVQILYRVYTPVSNPRIYAVESLTDLLAMAQKLQLVSRPLRGQAVFVSPHIQAPWGSRKWQILGVVKSDITINFLGGVYESFPLWEIQTIKYPAVKPRSAIPNQPFQYTAGYFITCKCLSAIFELVEED